MEKTTRGLIAFALLMLMTVVVATSQPGLRYCLCFETAFFGNCECVSGVHCAGGEVACDSHACACQAGAGEAALKSCEDCSIDLSIDLGDFADVTARGAGEKSLPPLLVSLSMDRESNLSPRSQSVEFVLAHGSPPPLAECRSMPLHVRFAVFLV